MKVDLVYGALAKMLSIEFRFMDCIEIIDYVDEHIDGSNILFSSHILDQSIF